jgi:hypothetical protein
LNFEDNLKRNEIKVCSERLKEERILRVSGAGIHVADFAIQAMCQLPVGKTMSAFGIPFWRTPTKFEADCGNSTP